MGKKIMFSFAFLLGGILFGSTYESASAATHACDNDPSSIYSCSTYSTGTWTLNYSSSNYNGDARLANYNTGSYFYNWAFSNYIAGGTWNLRVYLANSSFIDPNARYYVYNSNWLYDEYVGSINQFAAPTGWSYVGVPVYLPGGYNRVTLQSSQINTGADAITLSN
ncbi:hypothetical protein MHB44_02945 [Lysinibacillus sp. FSL H8-0500]|uniref:hypothetical protein n=1 Tax=Lysinibacillus sp. FSL H8-0500 TaxID=2921393 RepID=UPI00310117E9